MGTNIENIKIGTSEDSIMSSNCMPPIVWKCIRGGIDTPTNLIYENRRSGVQIDRSVDLMFSKSKATVETRKKAVLAAMSPRQLGFDENPSTEEILNTSRLQKWSADNSPSWNLTLCPPIIGLALRKQYLDQACGENIWIAMEPVLSNGNQPEVLKLSRDRSGAVRLTTEIVPWFARWSSDCVLVFLVVRRDRMPNRTPQQLHENLHS